jgi:hypothetical protein
MCSIRQNVALSTFWEVFHIKHLVALTKVQTHASDRNACIMYIDMNALNLFHTYV